MVRVVVCVMTGYFFMLNAAFAQGHIGTAKVFVFADVGIGLGLPQMLKATANVQFLKHHELSMGYAGYTRDTKQLPDGWVNGGLGGININPQETYSAFSLAYGYVLNSRKKPARVRYVLRAGITTGALSSPINFRLVHHSGIFSFDSWEYEMLDRNMTAFTLNPVVQYTPMKGFGLSAGVYCIFSQHLNGAGITGSLLFGKVSNTPYIYKPKKRGWGRRNRK